MSYTDPDAPSAQPDGQGGQGDGNPPYAEYLSRVPEEARAEVEQAFRQWDADVTRRFQESAEFRRQWEPYQELGVNQLSPEDVEWALQFRQAAVENPESVQDWYQTYAQAHGLVQSEPAAPAPPADDGGGYLDYDPDANLQQSLTAALAPMQAQLEAMNQWREAQEAAAAEAAAQEYIQGQLAELKERHGDEFNEAIVEKFIPQYIHTDPRNAVTRAFADSQELRAQIERDTLQSKVGQPRTPESGGVADVNPSEIKTLQQARQIALQQLRQNNRG